MFFHIRMTERLESFVVKERGRPTGAAPLVQFCIQFRYVQSCQNVYFTKIIDNYKYFLYNVVTTEKGGFPFCFANHTGRNTRTENRNEKSFT